MLHHNRSLRGLRLSKGRSNTRTGRAAAFRESGDGGTYMVAHAEQLIPAFLHFPSFCRPKNLKAMAHTPLLWIFLKLAWFSSFPLSFSLHTARTDENGKEEFQAASNPRGTRESDVCPGISKGRLCPAIVIVSAVGPLKLIISDFL